ncbi:lipase family protein [Bacillus sp. FJAT-42376]|uniref:lipase family protein n=1 Tax=Bacillus sp. FJAT-42376 TaxID=2014076 RepID=UPI000F4EBFBA|nr:lipase family protein [Bacillus sp. FJAT-42376]AZB44110.1 lipase family protein [Bacillus sp. FJAT-42376]
MNLAVKPDRKTAVLLADCCLLAYDQVKNGGDFKVPDGFVKVAALKGNVLGQSEWIGFIIESDQHIITAFRGSQSDPDWAATGDIEQAPYPYSSAGFVHDGFLGIYRSFRNEFYSLIKNPAPRKSLYFTGHSLGAALAGLASLDAAENTKHSAITMYNFGSPKIGNRRFVSSYGKSGIRYCRFVNKEDLIPFLPPAKITDFSAGKNYYYAHLPNQCVFSLQTGTIAGNHSMKIYRRAAEKLAD